MSMINDCLNHSILRSLAQTCTSYGWNSKEADLCILKWIALVFFAFFSAVLCAMPASAAPFAYVTNQGTNTVSVIDTATNTVTDTVTVGSNPAGVAVTPDGDFAYVANYGSGTVSVIATATNTVVTHIRVMLKSCG